jgi:hypothetical protein
MRLKYSLRNKGFIKIIVQIALTLGIFYSSLPGALAQEKIYPLYRNSILQEMNGPAHKTISGHFKSTKILKLPFFDDFSTYTGYPNDTLWQDNYVFVNTGYAVNPPSIGVATFDGLNSRGLAYEPGNQFSVGSADTLTSAFIDLSGLQQKDSLYLSFFYQPQGLGESPDISDSFILEFKPDRVFTGFDPQNNKIYDSAKWITMWSMAGSSLDSFRKAYIRLRSLPDTNFFHGKFQFRFRNIANKSGNLDIWNLDYVYLDRGRRLNDSSVDIAIYEPAKGLINHYSSIPWLHYIQDTTYYYRDNIDIFTHNNSKSTKNVTFNHIIYSLTEKQVLASSINKSQSGNIKPKEFLDFTMPLLHFKNNLVNNLDSVVLQVETISKGNVAEAVKYRNNDTGRSLQVFNNYFAYDDGTAETGYGIGNSPTGAKVAVKFRIRKKDTLFGIGIHFNQSLVDVRNQFVNLLVWKQINYKSGGTQDVILSQVSNINPEYANSRNGFVYFPLDTPLVVNDSFYIGWSQTTDFLLNVGFDRNYPMMHYPSEKNLFYSIDGVWSASKLQGIPIIRAYVGKRPVFPSGIETPISSQNNIEVNLYPNPCHGMFNIEIPTTGNYEYELLNMQGKVISGNKIGSGDNAIDISSLPAGIYMVHIKSRDNGSQSYKKLVIY